MTPYADDLLHQAELIERCADELAHLIELQLVAASGGDEEKAQLARMESRELAQARRLLSIASRVKGRALDVDRHARALEWIQGQKIVHPTSGAQLVERALIEARRYQ